MKWRSVWEKRPNIKQGSIPILAYTTKGHANDRIFVSHFYIPKNGGDGRFAFRGINYDYWMPMPKPPVKDEAIEEYLARTKSKEPCFGGRDSQNKSKERL